VARRILPFWVIFLLAGVVGGAFAQTEDDIVAKFLNKTEKKHFNKVGFVSAYFSYGKLSDNNPYNKYSIFVDNNVVSQNPSDPKMDGAYRSDQLGITLGMMMSSKLAVKLGFEYWLKMGTNRVGNYNFSIAPFGQHNNFNLISELKVYGVTGGIDFYVINSPDKFGELHSLAVRLTGGGGFYMTEWKVWQGDSSFNLSTGYLDATIEPLKGAAPAYYAGIGFDVPIKFLGLTLGTEAIYMIMNFNNVKSYNSLGEELYLSYPDNTEDRVNLDYSGPRAKLELKKFFSW